MLRIFVLAIFFLPLVAGAHQAQIVDFERYEDNFTIEETQMSHAFYGELTGFPHTYDLEIPETQNIRLEILLLDIEGVENNKNLILVKKKKRGGVDEVTRLQAGETDWVVFRESFGGDKYRRGNSFEGELEAGSHLVEVSTPDNSGKYVLVVGELGGFKDRGLFRAYKDIYLVKKFFGKSTLAVFQSPLYYVPTVALVLLVGLIYWRKHNKLNV